MMETDMATIKAAEDAVSVYLHEFGPIVAWDCAWFEAAFEADTSSGGPCRGADWEEYSDAARAALRRSQSADLARDPREDESQWRTTPTSASSAC